jgi:glucose/arabinose dehydrogenase
MRTRKVNLLAACSLALTLPALVIVACAGDEGPSVPGSAPVERGGDAATNDTTPGARDAAPAADGPHVDPCTGVALPSAQHFVAAGLCATLVAADLGQLRQITFAPNGDLFGVTIDGSIKRLRDVDGDGFFQPPEIVEYANNGHSNNCHIDASGGFLYAGSGDGVQRWPYAPTSDRGGAPEDVVVGQPSSGHTHHTVHVYDGYLYVHSGSADDATDPDSPEYDDDRSLVRRFPLAAFVPGSPFSWLSGEIVTRGLRNANGFTRNAAGRMYAVVNGMDIVSYRGLDLRDDNPGEQVVEIAIGKSYGFPFCFTAQRVVLPGGAVVPAGTQLVNELLGVHDDAWCDTHSSRPATFLQAHAAPLDLVFFDAQPKGALPERYRGGAFVALHGSHYRSTPTGYQIVWIPFDGAGRAPMPASTATSTTFPYETVLGGGAADGPKDGAWSWSAAPRGDAPRFAGVAISPIDGALYASTDSAGYVYRIRSR